MPTLPPERGRFADLDPAHLREVAASFGTDAARYDRARPRYPEAMVARIVAESPGPDVLDVGIGTGVAAAQFQAAGCRVLGVDVDRRMADLARAHGFDVEVSAFEDWDPAGRLFDAVTAGQSWHWVDPVAGAAKAAAALRPGGRLALCWNVFQAPLEVGAAFAEASRHALPGPLAEMWTTPALESYTTMFTKAQEGLDEVGHFDGVQQWRYRWDWRYSKEAWLDALPTFGGFTRLPPAQLEELLAGIGAATDALGGSFTAAYTTVVVTSTTSR